MIRRSDLDLLIAMFGTHSQSTIKGRTRIQKTVCALKYHDEIPFNFNFKSYFYGPYSSDLTNAINYLVGMKILKENVAFVSPRNFRYDYGLTDQGHLLFNRVQQRLRRDNASILQKIGTSVEFLEGLPLVSLSALLR